METAFPDTFSPSWVRNHGDGGMEAPEGHDEHPSFCSHRTRSHFLHFLLHVTGTKTRLFITFLTRKKKQTKKNVCHKIHKKLPATVRPPDRDFSELSPRKQPPSPASERVTQRPVYWWLLRNLHNLTRQTQLQGGALTCAFIPVINFFICELLIRAEKRVEITTLRD